MSSLSTPLRRQLEEAVKKGRRVATAGARKALEGLAVHEPDPYPHMDAGQRDLRRKLQAQAKQLGGGESASERGRYEIKHLAEKLAYDQWHRILFARYLLENNLLISPDHGVSVSLDDCEELAPALGLKDAWAVAARFAARELPEIFRADDPAGAVDFAAEDRKPMIDLVTGLPLEVFTATDSLGWCYQFWQAERKDEVNASGNKIGADELPAVTQLFTEDYMVDFLLDNTLGAWHAGKILAANPGLAESALTEDELRKAVALPGCPWTYLRFIKTEEGAWTPAAGTFAGWPKAAKALKCLDPCMGSGHFVVAMFERLVALRVAEEGLDEAAAVPGVIRENLFGLEIDPRCTQIGAFNLALSAWRRMGHSRLPAMNIACSGIAPNTTRTEWLKLVEGAPNPRFQMGALHDLFDRAPVLGSLISPKADRAVTYGAAFQELQPLLEGALGRGSGDDTTRELAVTAGGIAKAAEILVGQFNLVGTNFPFLGLGKMSAELGGHVKAAFYEGRQDLSAAFLLRALGLLDRGGAIASVSPSEWTFAPTYREIRRYLLKNAGVRLLATLGSDAFFSKIRANPLLGIYKTQGASEVAMLDLAAVKRDRKPMALGAEGIIWTQVVDCLDDPDCKLVPQVRVISDTRLGDYAEARSGLYAGDIECFERCFWEVESTDDAWEFLQGSVSASTNFGGRNLVVLWEQERGLMSKLAESVKHLNHAAQNWRRGKPLWGHMGAAVSLMGDLSVTIYSGERYNKNCCAIVPKRVEHLPALVAYCVNQLGEDVRAFDRSLKVDSPQTLVNLPFDLAHWQEVASEKYPNGLPKPFSADPTQWLFNGHPVGADNPLHVAVTRLLGYQWPRQMGSGFPDCPALGPDELEKLADADGIVPISPTKGEGPAAERLRELLARAFGKDWSSSRQEELLAQVGYAGASLEEWLRNGFFEQHCGLFHHRPFIWHIWDGVKNGFSALVNYHKLTHANLEKLSYSYLGDWIRRQQAAVEAGESGSDKRLEAARRLQTRLKMILDGEPPFDIFVRWKPLSQQAVSWHPDINDGVRMNIRPFMAEDIPGGKKGAGILRSKPNIKWDKDRGKEPQRDKKEFPWFWSWDGEKQDFAGGRDFDGNRWNDCHYSNAVKQAARTARK